MVPWKRIGICIKTGQGGMAPVLEAVLQAARESGLDAVLESEAAAQVAGADGHPIEEVADLADLLVVLGGDGTVLRAARAIGSRAVPLVGINLGRLGFLADIPASDAGTTLRRLLGGEYALQERARLEVVTWEGDREVESGLALNDAVFGKGPEVARLIDIETRVDGHWIGTYRADGLVVSTPTGSTGYNLSAGGPILDPQVDAVILTPICPHTLSVRPLVLRDRSTVEVRLRVEDHVQLTLDGQVRRTLRPGEIVRITRSAHSLQFLTLPDRDHFETVRTKLGWGSR